MAKLPTVAELLTAAVTALGGQPREGQQRMAEAVAAAISGGEHLAVQAGTGTGKSLGYLVPALRHAVAGGGRLVVSTATIALQRQLVDRDLPRLAEVLAPRLKRRPSFAMLKGRRNYLCLHRLHGGVGEDAGRAGDALFDPVPASALGRQVARLHEWAQRTETGDRDELVPGVGDQAWRQVSVSARECLGAARCPVALDCFAEKARAAAGQADVVVTNHALLAIDALEDRAVLPEHDVVVVDEAHGLVDRVTAVATGELTASHLAAAARRCGRLVRQPVLDRLLEAGEGLAAVLRGAPPGLWDTLPAAVGGALTAARDAASACRTSLGSAVLEPGGREDAGRAIARRLALALVDEVSEVAERLLAAFAEEDPATRRDVVWLATPGADEAPVLRVAPLSVGELLRDQLFGHATVVLTSATLALGGSFDPLAKQWGLPPMVAPQPTSPVSATDGDRPPDGPRWTGVDVGSPFAHRSSGILYVARHLPPPGRELAAPYLDEVEGLVMASGGRALGLFSSMRAATAAAAALRERRPELTLFCQGEDATPLLVRRFTQDEGSCLFGTLSLWQGVDVPGPALQLVLIDRIPFPRPDDPLVSARQRAVAAQGGNGFLAVSATHAALLLAQGAGRLLRGVSDRGVVAVLDPRLATARYGAFLRASLPPFWTTTDPDAVRAALRRLTSDRLPPTP